MIFYFRRATIIVLLLALHIKLHATQYQFNHYTISHGLPAPSVLNICQDSRGFLWLGTTAGVSRFDGKHFINYNTSNGLINNSITAIFENQKKEIVIGTFKGISVFNGTTFTNTPSPIPGPKSYITDFFQSENGKLHLLVNNSPYEFKAGHFIKEIFNSELDTLYYNKICRLINGDRVLTAGNRLYIVKPSGSVQIVPFSKKVYQCVKSARPTSQPLLIAEDGIYRLVNSKLLLVYQYDFTKKIILATLLDSKERLWVSIENNGVLLFDSSKLIQLGKKDGLDPLFTTCIFEDDKQRIWIGNGRGLYQVKAHQLEFYNNANGLAEQDIRYMRLESDGKVYLSQNSVWFGYIHDAKIYQPPVKLQRALLPYMRDSRASGFSIDHQNRLWIAITGGKLLRINGNHMEDLSNKFGKLNFFNQELYYSRIDSTTWVPQENGVVLLRNDTIVKRIEKQPDGSPVGYVNRISADSRGNIWLSTRTDLFVYRQNKLNKVSLPKIAAGTYNYFQCEQDNLLWFATENNGILGCTFTHDKLVAEKSISDKNGLSGFQALSIVPGENHELWVATTTGICIVNLKNKSATGKYYVYRLSNADGIPFTDYVWTQLVKDKNGDIWNSNLDGLLHFKKGFQYVDTLRPLTVLEKFTVRDSKGEWGVKAGGSTFFGLPNHPKLAYFENNIGFEFSGISLGNAGVSYYYKLDGIQTQWREQSENTPIYYYNLPPGDYNFSIKSVAASGYESYTLKYRFSITPPFWKTWWFKLSLFALILCLVIFLIKWREASIKRENKIQLQMSELRMHALQAQMNPHFIFNSLNSIQNYILSNDSMSAAKYLSKFAKLIRRILDNSRHSFLLLEEVLEVLKMYVELEAFRFSNEFTYHFDIQEEEDLMSMPFPPMLLQPFVENAIWHGLMPKSGDKELLIKIYKKEKQMVCVIDDNGVGRKLNKTAEGHISQGEKITKGLLQSMQEIQHLDASIEILDKTNELGPSGTTVTLIINLPS